MASRQERQELSKKVEKKQLSKLKAGPGRMSQKLATYWKEQVGTLDQAQTRWVKRGETITRRYRDDRSRTETMGRRRMNVLWTNVQIMKPAIYSMPPTPVVDRKFLDHDVKARLSAQILERSLKNEQGPSTYHDSISRAVLDYLLPGRGQCWVRYEPDFGEGPSLPTQGTTSSTDDLTEILDGESFEDESEDDADDRLDDEETEQLDDSGDQVISEKAPVDYIDWHDFYMFPAKARTWREVQAVGKRVYMSRHEAVEFFGEEIGNEIQPDTGTVNNFRAAPYSDTAILEDVNDRNLVVFEVWNKTDRRVYWFSQGYQYLCKVEDDPLQLMEFFPCPQPLIPTYTNDTIIPIPDYHEWQDQAIQIDELTERIAMLSKCCKVAGTYDAKNGALKRLLNEDCENQLIPVDSWAVYAEQGGVQGSVSFLPLDQIILVIKTLTEVRQQVKQDLDEVTGLSDVVRGTTDSRETLGGIRLKNNNAGTRLEDRQMQVATFARNVLNIQAEIIAKHFSDETLIESSGILFEDELQPDTMLYEIKNSDDFKSYIKKMQTQMQQQQQMQQQPQASQQPTGNNVVPFNGSQQSSQTPQQPPQAAPITDDMIDEQLKQAIPSIIQKRVSDAIELLRKDVPRRYRIEIETDSTIFADKEQDKENVTEFLGAVTQFLTAAETLSQSVPEAMPVMAGALQWAVRKYRVGRDLESRLDTFAKQITAKSKQMIDNPPPNPEVQKQQMELQKLQQEMQMQQANDQRDAQRQAAEDQRDAQLQAADDQRKGQLEQAKSQLEIQKAELEFRAKQAEIRLEFEQMERENDYKQQEHERKLKEMQAKTSSAIAIAKAKPKQQAAAAKKTASKK